MVSATYADSRDEPGARVMLAWANSWLSMRNHMVARVGLVVAVWGSMSNQCDRVDATFGSAGLADSAGERVIVAYRVTVHAGERCGSSREFKPSTTLNGCELLPSYALDCARKAAYRYAERLSADYGSYCATVNPVWGAK